MLCTKLFKSVANKSKSSWSKYSSISFSGSFSCFWFWCMFGELKVDIVGDGWPSLGTSFNRFTIDDVVYLGEF